MKDSIQSGAAIPSENNEQDEGLDEYQQSRILDAIIIGSSCAGMARFVRKTFFLSFLRLIPSK